MDKHYIAKLNNKCNANCLFCGDTLQSRQKQDMDFNELIKKLKERRLDCNSLLITGGEPAIHNRVFEYIRAAKDLDYKQIIISTNGILMQYPEIVAELVKSGLTQFQVSFQTTDPKRYEVITGVPGAFDCVVKGIANMRDSGIKMKINTVIHKMNYELLPQITDFLIDQKPDRIQLSYMNPIGSSIVNNRSIMQVKMTLALPFIKQAFKVAKSRKYKRLYIENIPLCLIPDHIPYIEDLNKPAANRDYYIGLKTKIKGCEKCLFADVCDGLWIAYYKQFGGKEIRPVKDTATYRKLALLATSIKTKRTRRIQN